MMIDRTIILLLLTVAAIGSAQADERVWSQQKAMATVDRVKAVEEIRPLPYEKIAWLTDMAEAEKQAKAQQKPIFVYWYVDKGGPDTSPC